MCIARLIGLVLAVNSVYLTVGCHRGEALKSAPQLNLSSSFNGVTFKPGRPYVDDSLEDALSLPVEKQLRGLKANGGVRDILGGILSVEGLADNVECTGAACDELSFRRAKIVYDWMVANGVAKEQLELPVGYGNKFQLNENSTEEERQINRRTEVTLVVDN